MKAVKRVTSVMLMLAMVSTLVITAPTLEAKEADSVFVTVNIQAPYEVYYDDVDSLVQLEEKDLKDDFGIGLSTDGSDKVKFTAIRAIAKKIREHIKLVKNIKDDKKANEEMKNFIQYKDGFISAFSNDGVNWNTGAFEGTMSSVYSGNPAVGEGIVTSGSSATIAGMNDGYWGFFDMYTYSDKSVNEVSADDDGFQKELTMDWIGTHGTFGQPDFKAAGYGVINDKVDGNELGYHGYELAGKKTTFRIERLAFDATTFKYADLYTPASGAAVSVYDDQDEEVCSAKADAKGFIELPAFDMGSYTICAWEPGVDNLGRIFSKMTYTEYKITFVDTPKAPTKVKAKTKKKKVIVTFKPVKNQTGEYYVFTSKKKNGKYNLVANAKAVNSSKITFKKTKNAKFVKVKQVFEYEYGDPNSEHIRAFESEFTKAVKVK
ncbi:MAG: hypothetical protein IKQ97_05935 [Eubacterium sp.]|nr:hypothetical protein [Eubacterium sp.]